MNTLTGILMGLISVISISANASFLVASPASVDFPNTPINGPTQYSEVSVINQGPDAAQPLIVQNFCGSDFYVSDLCPGILEPYQSCEISVQFHPSHEGSFSCSVQVTSSGSTAFISVYGQGVKN